MSLEIYIYIYIGPISEHAPLFLLFPISRGRINEYYKLMSTASVICLCRIVDRANVTVQRCPSIDTVIIVAYMYACLYKPCEYGTRL